MLRRSSVVPAALTALATLVGLLVAPTTAALATGTPSAPRSVRAVPANQQVTVTWRAPSSTGGAAINNYRVVYWRSGTTTKHTVKLRAAARKLVVKSLRNGSRYYFQVAAHNRHGWGKASTKIGAVPRTIPGAPVDVLGTPKQGAMGLTWSAPASNGGAAVGRYAVRVTLAGGPVWSPAVTDSGTDEVTTTSTTVHDLHDGTPYAEISPADVRQYWLQVRAHNAAGWGPWSALAMLAPTARVQMPPFVPGNSFGDAAAAGFVDWLTGSYWTDGYPTAAGTGVFHDGGPMTLPVESTCGSNPAWACANNLPQDPAPTAVLDFTEHNGDSPRRVVSNVPGQQRYDLTYRARVTTPTPIEVTSSGVQCTVNIDSAAAGNTPDITFTDTVTAVGSGWATQLTQGNAAVSLESADYQVSGGPLCSGASVVPASSVANELANAFASRVQDLLADTCGTDEPYYWQPCYPILDAPPPAPPAAAATPRCPGGTPYAGPYLTLTCNGSTLVRTCASGWADLDGNIADGCEHSKAGVVAMHLDDTTKQALVDHLSGSFFLGGYPSGVGTGSWYAAANPRTITLPLCVDSPDFGCPHTVQQQPLPTLTLDLGEYGDPDLRRQALYDSNSHQAQLVLRARMKLTASVAFLQDGVSCQVQIDSTHGAQPDVTLNFAAMGSGNGPLAIAGYDDSVTWSTIQGLEDDDIVFGPHRWCSYWSQGRFNDVRTWIRNTLVTWAQHEGELCGAPDPYYWQRCPS